MPARLLLVNDGSAWFIRRVKTIEHDLSNDEKVYHCDEHLGGPFTDLNEAVVNLQVLVNQQIPA